MELNRKLRQCCWLEVTHFVLDDSFGCCQLLWYCPFITSFYNFHFYFHFYFRNFSRIKNDKENYKPMA